MLTRRADWRRARDVGGARGAVRGPLLLAGTACPRLGAAHAAAALADLEAGCDLVFGPTLDGRLVPRRRCAAAAGAAHARRAARAAASARALERRRCAGRRGRHAAPRARLSTPATPPRSSPTRSAAPGCAPRLSAVTRIVAARGPRSARPGRGSAARRPTSSAPPARRPARRRRRSGRRLDRRSRARRTFGGPQVAAARAAVEVEVEEIEQAAVAGSTSAPVKTSRRRPGRQVLRQPQPHAPALQRARGRGAASRVARTSARPARGAAAARRAGTPGAGRG